MKRARKTEPAIEAVLSNYTSAVLTNRGVSIIRSEKVARLNDDEMDRLVGEWVRFRAEPMVHEE